MLGILSERQLESDPSLGVCLVETEVVRKVESEHCTAAKLPSTSELNKTCRGEGDRLNNLTVDTHREPEP